MPDKLTSYEKSCLFGMTQSQSELDMAQWFAPDRQMVIETNSLTVYFEIIGKHDNGALERAFNSIVKINDSLRLKIVRKGFKDYQYITDFEYRKLNVVQLECRETMLEHAASLYESVPLPKNGDYLVWGEIAEYGDNAALIMRLSHYVADGYSIGLIFKQLSKLYTAFENGKEEPVIKVGSIKDYVKAIEDYNKSPDKKEDIKHIWKRYNSHLSYTIPVRKGKLMDRADMVEYICKGEEYKKLFDYANSNGYSMNFLFHGICGIATYKITGKKIFNLPVISHGRNTYLLKNTVGCMMNIVPVFCEIDEKLTVRELLKKHFYSYMDDLRHGNLPLIHPLIASYPQTIKCGFDVNHNWMLFSALDYNTVLDGKRFFGGGLTIPVIPYRFYNAVYHVNGEYIRLVLKYQKSIFKKERIEQVRDIFSQIISEIADNPDIRISDL